MNDLELSNKIKLLELKLKILEKMKTIYGEWLRNKWSSRSMLDEDYNKNCSKADNIKRKIEDTERQILLICEENGL